MRRAGYGWGDFVETVPTNPVDLDEHKKQTQRRTVPRDRGALIGLLVLVLSTVAVFTTIYILFSR